MDKVDQDIEARIKIGEMKKVEEILDTTPYLGSSPSKEYKSIIFGNTGFQIRFDSEGNTFDFMPEGKDHIKTNDPASENNRSKYASILGSSLFGLHVLLNDQKKLLEFGIDGSRITSVYALTNERLIDAVVNLFSRSNIPDLATSNPEKTFVNINLQGFKELEEEDSLIKYLKRLSERTKDTTVTYDKFVRWR